MVRAGRARRLWAWRFWYVAFRLGLVRFDWASFGKAVGVRRGALGCDPVWDGKFRQGGSGKAGHGKAR